MSTAIGTRQCGHLGCSRKPDVHHDGACVHAFCREHESAALSNAYGPLRTTSRRASTSVGMESSADRQAAVAVGLMAD